MLSTTENETLTRIGPGTPAGELLRRYWHPVALIGDLTDDQPTKFVRVLGEDLVLFLDKRGRVGLLGDHCPHRGASLLYGRVEERGIACAYHGWLYDTAGSCLETPAEPADSLLYLTVKHRAYPVQAFCGMLWAYLGPQPAPQIPRIDVWVRPDGWRRVTGNSQVDCNWFQTMENSVDPAHLQILHQDAGSQRSEGRAAANTTRGFTDDVASFDFYELPYGIMKRRTYVDGTVDEHPLIFPNILREGNATQIRVPIDDVKIRTFNVAFVPNESGQPHDDPVIAPGGRPYKEPMDSVHPFTHYLMREVPDQDRMAWETQGPIANRTVERLATSDQGVVFLRQLTLREIEKVRQGLDPLGVIRDASHPVIDTNLDDSLRQMPAWRLPSGRTE